MGHEVAKLLVMVSSAVSAMAFDAEGRERQFFVPPLTSEELSQKEAINEELQFML